MTLSNTTPLLHEKHKTSAKNIFALKHVKCEIKYKTFVKHLYMYDRGLTHRTSLGMQPISSMSKQHKI